ncbi:MAG: entericidin A/B family lipoprotein [Verrucomicrobiota bacterium]
MKLILASALSLSLIVLTGCNTVKGFGEDLERAGQSLQNTGN